MPLVQTRHSFETPVCVCVFFYATESSATACACCFAWQIHSGALCDPPPPPLLHPLLCESFMLPLELTCVCPCKDNGASLSVPFGYLHKTVVCLPRLSAVRRVGGCSFRTSHASMYLPCFVCFVCLCLSWRAQVHPGRLPRGAAGGRDLHLHGEGHAGSGGE